MINISFNNLQEFTMALRPYKNQKPIIGKQVFIDETVVIIGDVTIGEHCSIWPCATIRGDVNSIKIGARTNIQEGSVLHVSQPIPLYESKGSPLTIGNDVTIGHRAILHGCTIHDRVLIGMGSIVLDDAEIADDVIIGAGSLVAQGKKLESGYLYIGSPVKQIRPLTEKEKSFLRYSAADYAELKDDYI